MHLSVCDRLLLGGVFCQRQVELADSVGRVFYGVSDFLPTVLLHSARGMLTSLTVIMNLFIFSL